MVKNSGDRVYITVINDLVTDQRVHRVAGTLIKEGLEPFLIGRRLPDSQHPTGLPWSSRRFSMIFQGGPLFYLFYNVRVFLFLLLAPKPKFILANDLDTLAASSLVARLRKLPLLYDSHEYFTELPELVDRRHVQAVWKRIEQRFLPGVRYAMTVSGSIAEAYKEKYGITFEVIRNLPVSAEPVKASDWKERFPGKKLLLYQGAINKGRGLEMVIKSMKFLDDVQFIIAGSGDIDKEIAQLIIESGVEDRVSMTGRLKPQELFPLSCQADLGLSVEEDLGLNYRFALPNKLFDYIRACVPVVCSDLPEMAKIVRSYGIGIVSAERDPEKFAEVLKAALYDQKSRELWQSQLKKAAKELTWEREEEKLRKLIRDLVGPSRP